MTKQEALQQTLAGLARERKTPKAIMSEIARRYPKASKRQITRAALAQMIEQAQADLFAGRLRQDFALLPRPDDK